MTTSRLYGFGVLALLLFAAGSASAAKVSNGVCPAGDASSLAQMAAAVHEGAAVAGDPLAPKPPLASAPGASWATKVADAFNAMGKQPLAIDPPTSVSEYAAVDAPNRRGPYETTVDGKLGYGVFVKNEGYSGSWKIFNADGTLAETVPIPTSQDLIDALSAPNVVPPFLGNKTRTPITLAGIAGKQIPLSVKLTAMMDRTPTGWALTGAAYQLPKSDVKAALGDPMKRKALLEATFVSWIGTQNITLDRPEWITRVKKSAVPGAYSQMLFDAIGGEWDPGVTQLNEKNMRLIGKAMISDGASGTWKVHYDNNDDMQYEALIGLNAKTGQVRVIGYRNDP